MRLVIGGGIGGLSRCFSRTAAKFVTDERGDAVLETLGFFFFRVLMLFLNAGIIEDAKQRDSFFFPIAFVIK